MAALTNSRQELFAQSVASGSSAKLSYQIAYASNSKNCDTMGARLIMSPKVKARILEIQGAAEHVTHMTIAHKRSFYARMMNDPHNKLRDRLRASELDSQLAGHIKAVETGGVHVNVSMVMLTEERREQLINKKRLAMERRRERLALPIEA